VVDGVVTFVIGAASHVQDVYRWAGQRRGRERWLVGLGVLVLAIATVLAYGLTATTQRVPTVGYDQFRSNLDRVESVSTEGNTIEWTTSTPIKPEGAAEKTTMFRSTLPSFGDPRLLSALGRTVAINPTSAPRYSWDVVVAATPFSTLAAVLAGFALVSMVAIVTLRPQDDGDKATGKPFNVDKLKPLLSAFLTLTVAAFMYAVLSGSPQTGGQSINQLFGANIVDWIFALGVLQVAVGITWMLFHYNAAAADTTTRWIVHAAVAVLAFALSGVAVQPLFIEYPEGLWFNGATWILSASILLAAQFIGMGRWERTSSDDALGHLRWVTRVAMVVVVCGVLLYGGTSAFSGTQYSAPRALLFSLPVIAPLGLAFFVLMYEATLPNPGEDTKRRKNAQR